MIGKSELHTTKLLIKSLIFPLEQSRPPKKMSDSGPPTGSRLKWAVSDGPLHGEILEKIKNLRTIPTMKSPSSLTTPLVLILLYNFIILKMTIQLGESLDRLETDRSWWREVSSASFYNPREVNMYLFETNLHNCLIVVVVNYCSYLLATIVKKHGRTNDIIWTSGWWSYCKTRIPNHHTSPKANQLRPSQNRTDEIIDHNRP